METYQIYRGYGIRYAFGLTTIESRGEVIYHIFDKPEIKGVELAKHRIDKWLK